MTSVEEPRFDLAHREWYSTERQPIRSWNYIYQVRERLRRRYNLSMIIEGEMGTSKSYWGLKNLEMFDPNPSIDKVVFTGQDFVKKVKTSPPGSWILFDEPGLGLSHRKWQSEFNRAVGQVTQSSRFLQVNYLFALPNSIMMDVDVRRISHAKTVMLYRGYGIVYRIRPNYFGNPPFFTPKLGAISFGMPKASFAKEYEEKRAEYHDAFFSQYFKEEKESNIIPESRVEQVENEVRKNLADYRNPDGRINVNKIVGKHRLGLSTAYKVKAIMEAENP